MRPVGPGRDAAATIGRSPSLSDADRPIDAGETVHEGIAGKGGGPRVAARMALTGAAMVGVTFGMARYGLGLTAPDLRGSLGLGTAALGSSRRAPTWPISPRPPRRRRSSPAGDREPP